MLLGFPPLMIREVYPAGAREDTLTFVNLSFQATGQNDKARVINQVWRMSRIEGVLSTYRLTVFWTGTGAVAGA